jgi:hypothetical protein
VKLADVLTEHTFVDNVDLEEACIRDAPQSSEPFVFYHLRLAESRGQLAWSSPVWLTL